MALSASARAQLARLAARYRAALPDKLSAIETEFEAARQGADRAVRLKSLRRLVHNLAGSAALHGLDEITERARDVDRLIDGRGTDEQHMAALAGAVDRLRRAFDNAANSAPPSP